MRLATPNDVSLAFSEVVARHDRENPDNPSHAFTMRWMREALTIAGDRAQEDENVRTAQSAG